MANGYHPDDPRSALRSAAPDRIGDQAYQEPPIAGEVSSRNITAFAENRKTEFFAYLCADERHDFETNDRIEWIKHVRRLHPGVFKDRFNEGLLLRRGREVPIV